jgi:hypothetical protein
MRGQYWCRSQPSFLRAFVLNILAATLLCVLNGCGGGNTPPVTLVTPGMPGTVDTSFGGTGYVTTEIANIWSARLDLCQWISENWTRRAYGTRKEVHTGAGGEPAPAD